MRRCSERRSGRFGGAASALERDRGCVGSVLLAVVAAEEERLREMAEVSEVEVVGNSQCSHQP